jgi:predicted dehydrogenase
MKENIKIGIIGLGQRGDIMLENPIIPMMKNGAGIEIAAVCDLLPDRVTAAAEKLEKQAFHAQPSLRIIKSCLKIKSLTRCI